MWWQQFVKELRGHRGEFLLLGGALVAWTLFLYSRVGVWPGEWIVGIYWFPSGFLPLWTIWTSVQLYRQEWRERTNYLLFSLPVRGWVITSTKLAAVVLGVAGFSALIGLGGWLLAARTGLIAELYAMEIFAIIPREWLVKMGLLFAVTALAGLVGTALLAQFAYVFSRMFGRFQGLAMVWTWFLVVWLMGRFGDLVGRLLTWLPDFRVRIFHIADDVPTFHVGTIESGPIVAIVLFALGLYWVMNFLVERVIEV